MGKHYQKGPFLIGAYPGEVDHFVNAMGLEGLQPVHIEFSFRFRSVSDHLTVDQDNSIYCQKFTKKICQTVL
jgi:hypothetical protein